MMAGKRSGVRFQSAPEYGYISGMVEVAREKALVFPMITYTKGNLLEDSAEALVNTVNEVGVMGNVLAKVGV